MSETYNKCPDWAKKMIANIRELEIKLGNIAESDKYHGHSIKELEELAREAVAELQISDEVVEAMFRKVAKGLNEAGFDNEEIAAMINFGIAPGAKLPYCDAGEVQNALKFTPN